HVFTSELFASQTPLTSTSSSRYSQPRGSGKPCSNKVWTADTMLVGMLGSARQAACCRGGSGIRRTGGSPPKEQTQDRARTTQGRPILIRLDYPRWYVAVTTEIGSTAGRGLCDFAASGAKHAC